MVAPQGSPGAVEVDYLERCRALIVQRERKKGKVCEYDALPTDDIVELCSNPPHTELGAGPRTMADAKTF